MLDVGAFLPLIGPLVAGAAGGLGSVRFVQESERGMRLRWGKVIRHRDGRPRLVNPGFVLVLPTIHHLRRIHVRTGTLALAPQRVMLADRTVFHVGALVINRIVDTDDGVYRALFEVEDVATSVEEFCAAALRDVLLATRHEELNEPDRLAAQVRDQVAPRLAEWGVEIIDFKLTDCSPSTETARLLLTTAEAEFRAAALNSAADTLNLAAARSLHPTVAAALIGTPVAVSLGDGASESGSAPTMHVKRHFHYSIFGSASGDSEAEPPAGSGGNGREGSGR